VRLAPHLPHVRELALTRALMIGIRELYGIERIDDDTYLQATETLRAANRAGLYERTFRDRMKVAAALSRQYDSDDPPWTMPAPGNASQAPLFGRASMGEKPETREPLVIRLLIGTASRVVLAASAP